MRLLKIVVLALCAAAIPSSAAMAAPALDGTFATPSGGAPQQIAAGPDGNMWVVLSGGGKEYAKVTPDGTITEFDSPGNVSLADVTSGPNNHLWFTTAGNVIEVDPATGVGTAHSVAQLQAPRGIVQGADGNLWVVDTNTNEGLVKVSPAGAFLSEHAVAGSNGRGITLGSDGRVWWADFGNGNVRATDTAGVTTSYPAGSAGLQEIAAGPTGQLAYTQQAAQPYQIGRVATADGAAQNTTADREPYGIDFGTDGAYWVTDFAADSLGRFTTDGQLTHPITLPAGSGPRYIAKGPNNTLWVTAETSKKVLRITGVEAPPPPTTTTEPPTPTTTTTTPPPPADTTAPVLSAAKVNVKKRRVTLTLSEPAALSATVEQKVKRGKKRVWKKVRGPLKTQGTAGANTIALGKKLKPGTYRVRLTATDAAGNAATKTVSFKVSAASRPRR
jgi:virginiamycin B lyase